MYYIVVSFHLPNITTYHIIYKIYKKLLFYAFYNMLLVKYYPFY